MVAIIEDDLIERLSRWIPFAEEVSSRRLALSKKYHRKITQKEIAEKIGITEKQLSRIETAISGTDYETICRLADALEYSEAEKKPLFNLAGYVYQSEIAIKSAITELDSRGNVIGETPFTEEDRQRMARIEKMLQEILNQRTRPEE